MDRAGQAKVTEDTLRIKEVARINKEELSQGVARTVLSILCVSAILIIEYYNGRIVTGIGQVLYVYPFISFAMYYYLKSNKGDFPMRRRLIMITDHAFILYPMHLVGEWGTLFFCLILWVIVGNGMRFGSRALIESGFVGIGFYIFVVLSTPYWINNIYLATGMLVGLLFLPALFLVIINRLAQVTEKLSRELLKTHHAATHDSLSGLANRAYCYHALNDKINLAKRYDEDFYIMFIDLDGFKRVNDRHGHLCGDEVIRRVSERLKAQVRESDLVVRLGGDEFAVILSSVTPAFDITTYAKSVVEILAEPIIHHSKDISVTASIGISRYPIDGSTAESLINAADIEMYNSKRSGKNKFTIKIGSTRVCA